MKIVYISAVLTATLAGGCASVPSQNCQVKDSYISGKYSGECKNGLASGHGTARGKDEYTGSFVAGEAHGQGTYTWASGEHYEGNWKNGNRDGSGTYTFASGKRYEGNWKNGNRDGSGKMIYLKGDEALKNLGSRGVWVGNKYVVEDLWKDDNIVQRTSEINKDETVTRNSGKLLGKRVVWTGFENVDSDDCISILFHTICHSVTYKFKFTGRVSSIDQNSGKYVVTLTHVQLIPQDFVAPMYWKYKDRAINWAAEQAGQARQVEDKYLSRS